MPTKDVIEQARFIANKGRLIRDRIFRLHATNDFREDGEGSSFPELSIAQVHTVTVTRDRGPITMKDLAEALGVSPPSASVMVDRLVEKGVLVREQSQEDRRKVLVRVSPDALEHIERVELGVFQSVVELVERIGPETARKWCEVLKRVDEVQEDGDRRGAATPGKKG